MQAVDESYREQLEQKYGFKFDKKYRNKGESRWIFMRRDLSSAIIVLDSIKDVDFSVLTTYLFHLVENAGSVRNIIEKVRSQVELASANEERFINGYHEFLKGFTAEYKKSKNYLPYFQALDFVQRYTCSDNDRFSANEKDVGYAVCDILMQGTAYFTKNEFDVNNMVVGLSIDGTPIEVRDKFPLVDAASYYIQSYLFRNIDLETGKRVSNTPEAVAAAIERYYLRYGYKGIRGYNDVVRLSAQNQIYNNAIINCIPVINEYTLDILPQNPFNGAVIIDKIFPYLRSNTINDGKLVRALHRRRRTLPANGAVTELSILSSIFSKYNILKIRLKETFVEKEMICVFNVETRLGDLCGYYNTATEWFYSPLNGSSDQQMHEDLRKLILWVYASYVCDMPNILPTEKSFSDSFEFPDGQKINSAKFLTIGGKAINRLQKSDNDNAEVAIFDRSKYNASERNINGFIRRLPLGQKASDRAVALAESYGFALAEDETFVQPFVRRQWICVK